MTSEDEVMQAQADIEDIDEVVSKAEETVRELTARRAGLLPTAERTVREIAALLHAAECKSGHPLSLNSAGCGWQAEAQWAGAEDHWLRPTHVGWTNDARDRVKASGHDEFDFLEAMRTVTPPATHEAAANEAERTVRTMRELAERGRGPEPA